MLANDFHIMDRKISIGYWKRKSLCKFFGVQQVILIILNFVKTVVFNEITNQRILQNIEKSH